MSDYYDAIQIILKADPEKLAERLELASRLMTRISDSNYIHRLILRECLEVDDAE